VKLIVGFGEICMHQGEGFEPAEGVNFQNCSRFLFDRLGDVSR
jgi:hypothetical protein